MKNKFLIFNLYKKLFKGQMTKITILLVIIFIFKVEVPLMLPLIIKQVFYTINSGNITKLFQVIIIGFIYFIINIAIMFFINVKGDPWITNFTLKASENVFKDMSKKYIGDIENAYTKEDIFNRILAGTGSVIALLFTTIDIIANIGSIILLIAIVNSISDFVAKFILIIMLVNFLMVIILFKINKKYAEKIQEKKSENLMYLRFMVIQDEFNRLNDTFHMLWKEYRTSRSGFYKLQKDKLIKNAICESCNSLLSGSYKLLLLNSFCNQVEQTSEYIKKVASLYSLYETISTRNNDLGNKIGNFPNSLSPINRLNQLIRCDEYCKNEIVQNQYEFSNIQVKVGEKIILNDVSLKIQKGNKIAIVGENGSGKSTLLKVMAGLCGTNQFISELHQKKIGYMPADNLLFQKRSVEKNVSYFCDKYIREDVIKELKKIDILDEKFIDKETQYISGGEAKRVNYVRAIMRKVDFIIADEPTSSLDEKTSSKVISNLLDNKDYTVIYVTHSPNLALMADEIVIINDGKILDHIYRNDFFINANIKKWANLQGDWNENSNC